MLDPFSSLLIDAYLFVIRMTSMSIRHIHCLPFTVSLKEQGPFCARVGWTIEYDIKLNITAVIADEFVCQDRFRSFHQGQLLARFHIYFRPPRA